MPLPAFASELQIRSWTQIRSWAFEQALQAGIAGGWKWAEMLTAAAELERYIFTGEAAPQPSLSQHEAQSPPAPDSQALWQSAQARQGTAGSAAGGQ